jgi:hypothetical protein
VAIDQVKLASLRVGRAGDVGEHTTLKRKTQKKSRLKKQPPQKKRPKKKFSTAPYTVTSISTEPKMGAKKIINTLKIY